MNMTEPQRILVVDESPIVRDSVAQWLRRDGHDVVTAGTGLQGLLVLQDFSRPIDWLYARAPLPGLIDGWILANAYHDRHADRPAILGGTAAGLSPQGDIVLNRPRPRAIVDALRRALGRARPPAAAPEPGDMGEAA